MSAQDLEQRARELLAAEYERGRLYDTAERIRRHDPLPAGWQDDCIAIRAIIAALRQQSAPVDLEQFREAVEQWKMLAQVGETVEAMPVAFRKKPEEYTARIAEADRLLSIIDNAGKVEPPLADETGPYPFGAGIEPNPKARYWQQRSAFWMAEALRLGYAPPGETPTHQPAPVVDDAMVERYLTAVHEHLGGLPSEQWDRDREDGGSTLRRIARIGLTAAIASAQGVQS